MLLLKYFLLVASIAWVGEYNYFLYIWHFVEYFEGDFGLGNSLDALVLQS
jgi:hypothetical protein